jgi:serine/threonine-protein kinase
VLQETVTLVMSGEADAPPESVEIPRRIGTVKIGEELGRGTGGTVFAAFDEALQRPVAVKALFARRAGQAAAHILELVEGIRAAGNIKHPNLVTLHAVETVNGVPLIVMELVDGGSLGDLLRRTGTLQLRLALYVTRSIAAAVEALHEAGVVHRDLKPANVLFDRSGHTHVCDFGLAQQLGRAWEPRSGQAICGTPLYMPPEGFEGLASPQGDVYALGCMLFEMLTGTPPFSAETLDEMRESHTARTPPFHLLDHRGVPENVAEVVRRALHKQRIMRYKTAGHFMRALEDVRDEHLPDETLRSQLAGMINATAGASAGDRSETSPAAHTTFDLIAERARAKRSQGPQRG